ncbi:hypothetical protein OG292_18280 [Streptomyces sp. NBC_01511]|uniref:hypothetical protein n=1 Tax=Streptomyces sp. NBC_01511 TaxID=2903889 RepID=UPI00386FEC2B
MTDFEGRLMAMLDELRSTEEITVDEAEEGSLATWITGPGHALEVIRKVAGVHLAPVMADSFHRYDGLRCYWRGTADSTIGGEFCLNHLVNVCVDEVPEGLSDTEWATEEWPTGRHGGYRYLCYTAEVDGPNEEEGMLHAFDQQFLTGTGGIAGFAVGDEKFATVDGNPGHPEIWYSVNTDGTLLRLDITYPEYLETLLLTRGLLGWQYLYADPRDPGFGYCRPRLGPDLDFLERTFPHDDFSGLRARWDAHLRVRDE